MPARQSLLLGIHSSGWRAHARGGSGDARTVSSTYQVLRASGFTCAGCGFRAKPDESIVPQPGGTENSRAYGFLQVHPRHGDHDNWRPADLDAVCPFCHETLHCGAGLASDSGSLILLPCLSQGDLCLMLNALAAAIAAESTDSVVATGIWGALEAMQYGVRDALGVSSTVTCASLAGGLLSLQDGKPHIYEQRERAIGGIRYLPNRAVFADAISYWRETSWQPISHWRSVYRHWLQRGMA